jgi:hypothetical protein
MAHYSLKQIQDLSSSLQGGLSFEVIPDEGLDDLLW